MDKLEKLFKFIASKAENRKRYMLNEIKYRFRIGGDPRSEFEKKYDRWKYLKVKWV